MPFSIEQAEALLGHRFRHPGLLDEALTHASTATSRVRSNERMEFLGDAVLGFVVCRRLFDLYPDLLEGDLTKIKSAVVSRRVCAKIAKGRGFVDLLVLGKGMADGKSTPSSVAAAVFESLIAAIYLDGGLDAAEPFILRHVEPFIEEAARSGHHQNFKSVLQHFAQRHATEPPQYRLCDEKGPDHAKAFAVGVRWGGRDFDCAWANAKKEAEQRAALLALQELGLADVDDHGVVTLREDDRAAKQALAQLDGEA